MELEAWIDEMGQIVQATTPVGFTMERTAFEIAFENFRRHQDVPFFLFVSLGPPMPLLIPGTPCVIYLDVFNPSNFVLAAFTMTDANGDFSSTMPLPADPSFAGIEFTMQARVCDPTQQGPIAGIPDSQVPALLDESPRIAKKILVGAVRRLHEIEQGIVR